MLSSPSLFLQRGTLIGCVCALSWIGAHAFAQAPASPAPSAGKPATEALPTADPAAAAQRIKQTGPGQYELGEIKFSSITREVRVPTVVNMREGAVEFALVHETGKTHESLLKMTASAVDLQVALLLCNYQAGAKGLVSDYEKDPEIIKTMEPTAPKTPGANRLHIAVEWQQDGKTQHMPLQQWMIETPTKKPPPAPRHWLFNGSTVQSAGFAAELLGNTIAIYIDRTAVINWPGLGNRNDDNWLPNTAVIPKEETPITLIISPEATAKTETPTKP